MNDIQLNYIICIEEQLNRRDSASFSLMKEADLTRFPPAAGNPAAFEDALMRLQEGNMAMEFVQQRLRQMGYIKGKRTDYPSFYREARINADVWSNFRSGTVASSKPTLLKIVIALRLNEDEARHFLSLAGKAYNAMEMTDRIIFACIDLGIYDPDTICEILVYYKRVYAKKGIVVNDIYADDARTANRAHRQKTE